VRDAHFHPQDPQFDAVRSEIYEALRDPAWQSGVANGTHPGDWPAVRAVCTADPRLLPAFGLHPWFVTNAPSDWVAQLVTHLDGGAVCVGEVGLDHARPADEWPAQTQALRTQWLLACDRNLPLTIHCVRAAEPLLHLIESLPAAHRGFLLHAYSGPPELVPSFAALGAFFSFSGHVADPRRSRTRAALRAVPSDRILLETDAPAMPLPPALMPHQPAGWPPHLNHPLNLTLSLQAVAAARDWDVATCDHLTSANFTRLFHLPH
jgi:TatD DNase family protein